MANKVLLSYVPVDWSKNCWAPCRISSWHDEMYQLSNVHTVQEAAEVFASVSTDSRSPEQLCLLSSLSTSAHHSGRACPAHNTTTHTTPPNLQLPEHLFKFWLCFMTEEKKNLCTTVKRNGSPLLCEPHQKSFLLRHCTEIHTHTHAHTHGIKSKSTLHGCHFENTPKPTQTDLPHVRVFWTDAKARERAQTGPEALGLCEYLCVSVCHF